MVTHRCESSRGFLVIPGQHAKRYFKVKFTSAVCGGSRSHSAKEDTVGRPRCSVPRWTGATPASSPGGRQDDPPQRERALRFTPTSQGQAQRGLFLKVKVTANPMASVDDISEHARGADSPLRNKASPLGSQITVGVKRGPRKRSVTLPVV